MCLLNLADIMIANHSLLQGMFTRVFMSIEYSLPMSEKQNRQAVVAMAEDPLNAAGSGSRSTFFGMPARQRPSRERVPTNADFNFSRINPQEDNQEKVRSFENISNTFNKFPTPPK